MTFRVEPIEAPKRKIDLTGIWGSCPGLEPFSPEDRVFDPSRVSGMIRNGRTADRREMKFLLDSNTIIDLLIGTKPALFARVSACEAGDLAISSISFGEVAHGSTRGKPPRCRF